MTAAFDPQLVAVRDHVFAPLAYWQRYTRIKSLQLPHLNMCRKGNRIDFETLVHPVASLSQASAAQVRAFQILMPAGRVTYRTHIARCSTCRAIAQRTSLHVMVLVNGRELSREFAA